MHFRRTPFPVAKGAPHIIVSLYVAESQVAPIDVLHGQKSLWDKYKSFYLPLSPIRRKNQGPAIFSQQKSKIWPADIFPIKEYVVFLSIFAAI
jgi:hypothetical protein